jgi:hypothetical protein
MGREMRPANDEMMLGYLEGRDLNNPEPSTNRSHSYRHGFANGRREALKLPPRASFDEVMHMADEAMALDDCV